MTEMRSPSPTVSILIPVFNRKIYVAECIQSALNQTFADFEIVVVDNASTDGTWEVCRQFASKDRRVRVFQNGTNIGPVLNWKRCIEEAKGVYGKLLFSDDTMAPAFLERAIPLLARREVGFVFSAVNLGTESGQGGVSYRYAGETGIYPMADFINASLFGGDTPISPGCAIFRLDDLKKNLLLEIPSPSIKDFASHGAGPDLLLYLLAAKTYPSFAFINEPLCFFRSHEESISVSDKTQHLSRCYIQAKIWFAETYLDARRMKNLYIHTWLEYCRFTRNWELPSTFIARHTKADIGILFPQLIGLVASRILSKLVRLMRLVVR